MASADFPTNGHNGQPGPGQQLYGFRKRRMAPLKGLAAPEPTFPPMATVASQAQDSNYMVSESDGWHLALERPRRACADFFTNGHRGQPCPGQQLIWFPKAAKGLAAPAPIVPPMATVASQAQDSNYMVSEWPARPRTANYMVSESDGWHLERPRRA